MTEVMEAVLDGHAVVRLGTGRPLLFLPGLSPDHELPKGSGRRFELAEAERYAATRQVWWVQRRQGLPPGTTIGDLAGHYAAFVRHHLGGRVDVVGASTGGSVALQLAADHPAQVRRLGVVASASRLGEEGRRTQRAVAARLRAGQRRRASGEMLAVMGWRRPTRAALLATGWLLADRMFPAAVDDMLTTIDAEDGYDVTGRLSAIETPTLVVGGERDRFYGAELFRRTAEALPDGHLLLHRRKGHAGTLTSPRTSAAVLRHLAR